MAISNDSGVRPPGARVAPSPRVRHRLMWSGPVLVALACSCQATCNGKEWSPSCSGSTSPPSDPCSIPPVSPGEDSDRFRPASWTMLPWVEIEGANLENVPRVLGALSGERLALGGVVVDEPPLGTFAAFGGETTEIDRFSQEVRRAGGHMILTLSPALAPSGGTTLVGTGPGAAYPQADECGWLTEDAGTYASAADTDGGAVRLDLSHPGARSFLVLGQRSVLRGASGIWLALPEERAAGEPTAREDFEGFCQTAELLLGQTFDQVEGRALLAPTLRGDDGKPVFCESERGLGVATRGHSMDAAGLAESIEHMLLASNAGFRLVGSRIGGEVASPTGSPFDRVVFARWTAAATFTPAMLHRLTAEGRPAGVPAEHADEMSALWRRWAHFHAALVAYHLAESRATSVRDDDLGLVITPLGDPSTFASEPRWMFGADLLVAPTLDASGKREIELPSGRSDETSFRAAARTTSAVRGRRLRGRGGDPPRDPPRSRRRAHERGPPERHRSAVDRAARGHGRPSHRARRRRRERDRVRTARRRDAHRRRSHQPRRVRLSRAVARRHGPAASVHLAGSKDESAGGRRLPPTRRRALRPDPVRLQPARIRLHVRPRLLRDVHRRARRDLVRHALARRRREWASVCCTYRRPTCVRDQCEVEPRRSEQPCLPAVRPRLRELVQGISRAPFAGGRTHRRARGRSGAAGTSRAPAATNRIARQRAETRSRSRSATASCTPPFRAR